MVGVTVTQSMLLVRRKVGSGFAASNATPFKRANVVLHTREEDKSR